VRDPAAGDLTIGLIWPHLASSGGDRHLERSLRGDAATAPVGEPIDAAEVLRQDIASFGAR
jgi:hypothetical protein